MPAGLFALTAAAIFAGAAFYVSISEQPARLQIDDRALLLQWKPSYKHGAAMQAPLALIGCVLGIVAWWQSGIWQWLAGAIALISAWPYTLLVIRPTNKTLLSIDPADAGATSRALIQKWGWLHAARTGMGIVSTLFYLWAPLT
jgi:Domain of unknown function (DUF1772)